MIISYIDELDNNRYEIDADDIDALIISEKADYYTRRDE